MVVTAGLVAVAVVHNPAVQRRAWQAVTDAVEEGSGFRIEAGDVRLRAFPARLVIRDMTVSAAGRTVLTVEEIRADWRWRRLADRPRRLEHVVVRGPQFFADALPPVRDDAAAAPEIDIWGAFEIGSFEVSGGRGSGSVPDIHVVLDDVAMRAEMVGGRAAAAVEAGGLVVTRSGRDLIVGPLRLDVAASADGVEVRKLEVEGEAVSLTTAGRLTQSPHMAGRFDVQVEADLPSVAEWWDPNLVTGLALEGRAVLVGAVELSADGGLTVELEHRGAPMGLAGYDLDALELSYAGGRAAVTVAGAGWGRADVTLDEPGMTSISAHLDRAPVDRLLAFAAPQVAAAVKGPTTATGRIDMTFSFPVDPATLAGDVDLVVAWSEGRVALRGSGVGPEWRVSRFEAQLAGVTMTASGATGPDSKVRAEVELTVADPSFSAATLEPWYPDLALLGIGGGPIAGTLRIDGTVARPAVAADLTWSQPEVGGRRLASVFVHATGGRDEIQWRAEVDVDGESNLEARGTARPTDATVDADWSLSIADLGRMAQYLPPDAVGALHGRLDGAGSLVWSQGGYRLDGRVDGRDVGTDTLTVPHLQAGFALEHDVLTIEDLKVEIFGGVVEGRMSAPLTDLDGVLDGQVAWQGLELAALPVAVGSWSTGSLSGECAVGGTVSRPHGEMSVVWKAAGEHPLTDSLRLQVDLAGGVVRAAIEKMSTRAGVFDVRAEAPLGDIARPPWLWADAPGGPVTAHLTADGFRFGPVAEMLAVDTMGAEMVADIQADIEWNPLAPDHPKIVASARGLRVLHPTGELAADGPVEVRLDGRRLHVEPVALVGFDSRIEVEASYDPTTDSVDGSVNAMISEDLARLLQMPVSVRGPFSVAAELHTPVSGDVSLESVSGTFTVDHGDGAIVMRDPPVEIRKLRVSANVHDGRIDIVDGSAEVNRGTVLVGGGWDPKSGQGVVFEIDDVTLFFKGTLTKWDGDLAVEPRTDELAHVAGDLTLVAGLWEESFDLTSALLGGDDLGLAADDPLYEISLDISVRGRSGVKVDNNLGRFDVAWDVLRIEGSAAEPRIHGSVRIAPGGTIGIGGRSIKVRRGTLEFTGDPAIDPVMEIVPESDMTLIGGEGGDLHIDPTLMATRGLAQGLSSVLGFENETLRPAEIAGQIERDPSVNFMVGQRLNPNLALFLSANLTDVQDRMTMLQGSNIRGLRGLVAQVFHETVDDNAGAALFQRFSWGGTAATLARPEIYRIKLEGDWPMSRRHLRKVTGLRRGQPFDPFLLFVGSVRMERALAGNGYQNARVTAFQEGNERSPTLVFYCDPGTPQFVRFVGDPPPLHVRSEVTSLYQPPPLETASLEAMGALVTRFFALQGFPDAVVSVERLGGLIVVDALRGQGTRLEGPSFDGLPDDVAIALRSQLGSANIVAAMARRPEALARAVERRLTSFGYLSAKVRSVEMVRLDPSRAEVRVDVEAGPRQTIDKISLIGSDPLGLMEAEAFGVRVGQPLDRETVDAATRNLRNAYIQAGFREARARSNMRSSADGRWTVEIELEPGRMRLLRNVEYSGLKHVSRRVLDKGVTVADGEVLTDQALDRSASQIANFSPIERVDVRTRDVGASEVDVDFEVVEKDRWAAEVGGGWSTERGTSASFAVRDDNLFGRGVGLNLRGGWGSTEQKLFLIGSLPPVPGGRLSLITTIGYVKGDAPDEPSILNQEEKLASFEVSYALANRVQAGLYYRYTDTRTFEKDPDPFAPPFDFSVRIGTVGLRTVVDHFDNLFDPRGGYGLTSDLGWSSQTFGSDLDYVSWLSNFSVAVAPFSGATWLQTARLGVAEPLKGQNLVRESRFFAGGQASIRGFDRNSVGPVTLGSDETLVPAGGGALFILNEELRIPVWGALRFAVFADIGQLWPSWRDADFGLSVGAGVGVRWSTPIGPLWADVAWPVADVGISSKKMKFYLGIGRPF